MRKSRTDWHWLVFFALIVAAWGALYALQPAPGMPAHRAGGATVFSMWALMTAAMMAPSMVPALAVYDDLAGAGAGSRRGFAELLGGYGAVWLGFAGLAALAQVALAEAAMLSPAGRILSPWLTAALLVAAGGYQFSALKQACLTQCQAPLMFFMANWRDDRWNAARMGLRLGALCLGCCWALMLLAFVGGSMNLLWMGGATVLMVLEKLPQLSRHVVRPLGAALIFAGVLVAAGAVI